MEFWAALAGAVVGAAAGGLVTWWVSARQWRRERRETAMESFLVMATERTSSYEVSDVSMGRTSRVSRADLEQAQVLVDLYAPFPVSAAAAGFIRADYENESDWMGQGGDQGGVADQLDFLEKSHTRLSEALVTYRSAMREALGLTDKYMC